MAQKSMDFLGPEYHYDLARHYFLNNQFYEAIAEYRSCLTLGYSDQAAVYIDLIKSYCNLGLIEVAHATIQRKRCDGAESIIKTISEYSSPATKGLKDISHPTYTRINNLADYIKELYKDQLSSVSVLDVGGGVGFLACFLPEVDYLLVEPKVNRISAFDIPFDSKKFDCVVSCHVLEHIPDKFKLEYLNMLCKIAKRNVILLNPFRVKNDYFNRIALENLQILHEVTRAEWAEEHIECGFPDLDLISDYAKQNHYGLNIVQNGSRMFTSLYVYTEFFAKLAGKYHEFAKINYFFNNLDKNILSNEFPNDYLCDINLEESGKE